MNKELLSAYFGLFDADGKIIPSTAATEEANATMPRASDAEKYRNAQSATLISAAERYFERTVTLDEAVEFGGMVKACRDAARHN
jgi:hypothetical protein